MKKSLLLCMAMMTLLASCGMLQKQSTPVASSASSTSVSSSSDGQTAGQALKALYTQYTKDGKYDVTNLSNIANTLLLIQSCKTLKTSVKDSEYWQSFAKGLIIGSDNLITSSINDVVTTELNSLMQNVDTNKLESARDNAADAAATAASTASSLKSIFNLFSK